MRITWKQNKRGRGDRREPGATMSVDGMAAGSAFQCINSDFSYSEWGWTAYELPGVPRMERGNARLVTLDAAKDACEAHIRECLKMPAKKKRA